MLETVINIAKGAGEVLLEYREKGFEIMKKSNTGQASTDIVTEADLAADAYIIEHLKKHFPEDKILTEETAKEVESIDRTKPVRIVDPLDGTKKFSEGDKNYGVLIGRCEKGVPMLGVCYFPLDNLCYTAEKGKGASCNNKVIKINNDLTVYEIRENHMNHILRKDTLCTNTKNNKMLTGIKSSGCTGISICHIAQGSLSGLLKCGTLSGKWDLCGPQVIVEESGGKVTDIYGNQIDYTAQSHFLEKGICVGTNEDHKVLLDFLN